MKRERKMKEKYILKDGEMVCVVHRRGPAAGPYGCWVMSSLCVRRRDGSKVYQNKFRGYSPYWLAESGWYYEHHRTGLSKADRVQYDKEIKRLEALAEDYNRLGEVW